MDKSKKEIYGDVHTFDDELGVLLSRLKPLHDPDVYICRRAFFSAVEGLYQLHYRSLQKFKTSV